MSFRTSGIAARTWARATIRGDVAAEHERGGDPGGGMQQVKAVVLNLVSLAATFGAITWFWQEGHGSQAVFSIQATGAITFWVPLMIFAFLFGLSMDYEVFILSRMREEYDRTGSTQRAVVEGMGRLVPATVALFGRW